MTAIDDLNDLRDQLADITHQRREIEADAFTVMCERPTYFAFKLLLGIGHTVPAPKDEEEPEIQDDSLLAPAH